MYTDALSRQITASAFQTPDCPRSMTIILAFQHFGANDAQPLLGMTTVSQISYDSLHKNQYEHLMVQRPDFHLAK